MCIFLEETELLTLDFIYVFDYTYPTFVDEGTNSSEILALEGF
jgi:hypothetical protein